MTRIHFVLEEAEKSRYQSQAASEGKSLSAWMREAAAEKLGAAEATARFRSVEELRQFVKECRGRAGAGREPDWADTKRLIAESKLHGLPEVP